MLKEGGVRLHIRPLFLIYVMKHTFFSWIICRYVRSPYLCTVFFIVLDLKLTKVGVQRYSFFYAHMSGTSLNIIMSDVKIERLL